ncbi:hypothetical protein M514_03464, partial [Trichuris suis]
LNLRIFCCFATLRPKALQRNGGKQNRCFGRLCVFFLFKGVFCVVKLTSRRSTMFPMIQTDLGRILVIGDGNLTFSLALGRKLALMGQSANIVATVFESRDEWMNKFASFHSTLKQLENDGIEVLFNVDVTKIDSIAALGQKELFNLVVFNFPHPSGKNNVRLARLLLTDFFLRSRPLLTADGAVAVTLLNSQCEDEEKQSPLEEWAYKPPVHKKDSWRPLYCASSCGFVFLRRCRFPYDELSEYGYRNTGFRGQVKAFAKADRATTLWFRPAPFADLSSSSDYKLFGVHRWWPFYCLDMSFWTKWSLDQDSLWQEILRFTKNLVKDIRVVEIYRPPIIDGSELPVSEQKERVGFCIRLYWQSRFRALTKELANDFQEQLKVHLTEWCRSNMIPFQPSQGEPKMYKAATTDGGEPHLADGNALVELFFVRGSTRLTGNFSTFGKVRAVVGYVVQLHPMRACELLTSGLDKTLHDHVAVVIMDGIVQPFMAGCVSPYNQAKFAQDSGAKAVVLDVRNLTANSWTNTFHDWPVLDIPVVTTSGTQANALRMVLTRTSNESIAVAVSISPVLQVDTTTQMKGFRDILSSSVFDKGILPALMLLLFFIVVFILVKVRDQVKAQNRRRSDFPVRILAEAALTRMELKKFSHTRKMKRPPPGEPNTATIGLLSDSSLSLCGSDLCAICLEVYKDGQTLRVISCGHEFHRKCVDPWLLANHTCPLCLFDVVLEKHVPSRQEPMPEPVESTVSPWPLADQRTPNASIGSQRQASPTANDRQVNNGSSVGCRRQGRSHTLGGNVQSVPVKRKNELGEKHSHKKRRHIALEAAGQKRTARRNRVMPRTGASRSMMVSQTETVKGRPLSSTVDCISEGYMSDISAVTECTGSLGFQISSCQGTFSRNAVPRAGDAKVSVCSTLPLVPSSRRPMRPSTPP